MVNGIDVGSRVRSCMSGRTAVPTQREMAEAIGMTPDALSRSLNGTRSFSSIELAMIAEVLGVDVYWLITGRENPSRLVLFARHTFDRDTREHLVSSHLDNESVLQDVALAYRQAFGDHPVEPAPLPSTAREVRDMLGADFVRCFADRVEERLGVDVVRIPGLTTAYGLEVLGRRVIVLDASGNWFRQNFSLAHELGHMVSRTPSRDASGSLGTADEAPANNFAAELLLPAAVLREMTWMELSVAELARRVWDWGVSVAALRNRLDSLRIPYSAVIHEWCAPGRTTQRLLRRGGCGEGVSERMAAAVERKFPLRLQVAHLEKIASGEITASTLAWMYGLTEDELDIDVPQAGAVSDDSLAAALDLSL